MDLVCGQKMFIFTDYENKRYDNLSWQMAKLSFSVPIQIQCRFYMCTCFLFYAVVQFGFYFPISRHKIKWSMLQSFVENVREAKSQNCCRVIIFSNVWMIIYIFWFTLVFSQNGKHSVRFDYLVLFYQRSWKYKSKDLIKWNHYKFCSW